LVGFFRIHLKALGKVRCGWVLSVEDTLSEAQGKSCARKDRMESSGWRFQTYVSYVHLLPGMKFMDVTVFCCGGLQIDGTWIYQCDCIFDWNLAFQSTLGVDYVQNPSLQLSCGHFGQHTCKCLQDNTGIQPKISKDLWAGKKSAPVGNPNHIS
jgi:hypothetical protein